MRYTIRPLDASTWAAFAELVERNNGVFGGCWCMGYHPEDVPDGRGAEPRREGAPGPRRAAPMPRSSSTRTAPRRAGASTAAPRSFRASSTGASTTRTLRHPPDWRITCLFVDKKHRGQGVARAALEGALDQIAHLGGGLVEAISEVTAGREAQGRFLFSATVELFEQNGFTRVRQVGKHAWIVSKAIQPA